jgi:hypothetical protein
MTEADSKYGEELRSALCAAADAVVPVGDGLEKIRVRTARRMHALDWWYGFIPYVPQRAVFGAKVAASWIAVALRGEADLAGSLRGARQRTGHRHGRGRAQWLRPALAAAGALVIVVAVALAIPRLRENVFAHYSSNTRPAGNSHNGGAGSVSGGGGPASSGSQPYQGVMPLGTKKDPSCLQASSAASTSGGGSSGGSSGGGYGSTGTTPSSPPAPVPTSTGASPGLEVGGSNVGTTAKVDSATGTSVDADAYVAQLMIDRPAPAQSSSVTVYPAPCAPGTTPPVIMTSHPASTPTTTAPTPPTTSTAPPSTPPTSPPATSTPPTSPPPTSTSPSSSPTGDGGGSTAPGPSPTGSASPG